VIETLLSRLDKVRKSGDGYTARCPAHEDRMASLSLKETNDRVLLHCFAGCSPADVLGAVGMGLGDLFKERLERQPISKRERKDHFALMASSNPSLAYDIEVLRAGLGGLVKSGILPGDMPTFIGSANRVFNALDPLIQKGYP